MNIKERKRLDRKDPKRYDWMYARVSQYQGYDAMGVIQRGYTTGVLKGQDMICFVTNFKTIAELEAAYPGLGDEFRNDWTAPQNYVDHLPDTGDY